jgi:hypothetical protein
MTGKFLRMVALTAALAMSAATAAEAAIGDGILGARAPLTGVSQVENAQYVFGGRNFCWYSAGWKGAGWYWCGYAARRGLGWGGPAGWRGWRGGVHGGWHGGVHGGWHGGIHRGGWHGGVRRP